MRDVEKIVGQAGNITVSLDTDEKTISILQDEGRLVFNVWDAGCLAVLLDDAISLAKAGVKLDAGIK